MKSHVRAFFCLLFIGIAVKFHLNGFEKLQEEAAEKVLELALFGETQVGPIRITQEEEDGPLKATLVDERPVSLLDIPGIGNIPLPTELKKIIEGVKIERLAITKEGKTIEASGQTKLMGEMVNVALRIEKKQGGDFSWSAYLALPKKLNLSQLSPLFKDTDIGFNDSFLVLSGIPFVDAQWGGQVNKGGTLSGTAKLSALGTEYTVPLKGLLKRDWVGSELSGRAAEKNFSLWLKDEGNIVLKVDNVELALGEKKLQIGQSSVQLLPEGGVKASIKRNNTLNLFDIPGMNILPMPKNIKDKLKSLTMRSIIIEGTEELVTLSGTADLFGSPVDIKVRALKAGQTYKWSIKIDIPQDVGLAQLSDYFKDANFKIADGFFVLSDINFEDATWGGTITKGLSISGTFIVPDAIATRLGIDSRAVELSGTITSDWIGSALRGVLAGQKFEVTVQDSGNLSFTFGSIKISSEGLVIGKALTLLPDGTFKVKIEETGSASLMDVPGMKILPIPSSLKSEFEKVIISDLTVEGTNELVLMSGKANLMGNTVDVFLRAQLTAVKGYVWSVKIVIPNDFSLARLSPFFEPVDLSIENGFFVLSQVAFKEVSWGGKVNKGLSLVGTFKVEGILKRLLDAVGTKLNEVTLKGVITANWIGSTFDMQIPGQIDFGKGIKTTGFILSLAIEKTKVGAPAVSLAIKTGILIELSDPFTINVSIKSAPDAVKLSGATEGAMKIPGVPLMIEDIKVQADLIPGVPSPGLGLGGIFTLGNKKVDMALYASPPDLLAKGEFKGGLSLQDIVQILNEVVKVVAKKEIDLLTQMKKAMPDLTLDRAKIYVAPKEVSFAGTDYEKGIEVDTAGNIFGKRVEFKANVSEKGLDMYGFLQKTELGPIVISGAKGDKGAKVHITIELPLENLESKSPTEIVKSTGFKAFIDALLQLNLGGKIGSASAQTTIDLTPTKALFTTKTDLFNKTFLVNIQGSLDLANPLSAQGAFTFEQSALDKLSTLLKQGSQEILKARDAVINAQKVATQELKQAEKKASDDLKKAQNHASGDLSRAKKDVESAQKELDSATNAVQSARQEAKKIKGDWDRVQEKLKECVG